MLRPGYKTTEFWFKIFAAMLIAALGAFNLEDTGLPPLVKGALALVIPLVLAYLTKKYGDNRTELKVETAKVAGTQAAEAVKTEADAAAVLEGVVRK